MPVLTVIILPGITDMLPMALVMVTGPIVIIAIVLIIMDMRRIVIVITDTSPGVIDGIAVNTGGANLEYALTGGRVMTAEALIEAALAPAEAALVQAGVALAPAEAALVQAEEGWAGAAAADGDDSNDFVD